MAKFTREQIRESLRLYAVTDCGFLAGRTLSECVAAALAGGATCVQLREKHLRGAPLDDLARELKALCAAAKVPFLVNDEVECALSVAADGVHVGQSDLSCALARGLLGPHAIIGVSVQTTEEARAAEEAGADYLGVGALFGTPTKPEAACVSTATLRDICASVSIPVVAIGGLHEGNIATLADTGIAGVALVSALFAADDIEEKACKLKACIDKILASSPPSGK